MTITSATLKISNITWPKNAPKNLPKNFLWHITEDDGIDEDDLDYPDDMYTGISDSLYNEFGYIPKNFKFEVTNILTEK